MPVWKGIQLAIRLFGQNAVKGETLFQYGEYLWAEPKVRLWSEPWRGSYRFNERGSGLTMDIGELLANEMMANSFPFYDARDVEFSNAKRRAALVAKKMR